MVCKGTTELRLRSMGGGCARMLIGQTEQRWPHRTTLCHKQSHIKPLNAIQRLVLRQTPLLHPGSLVATVPPRPAFLVEDMENPRLLPPL